MSFTKKNIKMLIKECMRELREGQHDSRDRNYNAWGQDNHMTPEDESKSKWKQFVGELDTQEGREFTRRVIDAFRADNDMLMSFLELAEDHPDHQDKFFKALRDLEGHTAGHRRTRLS